MPLLARSQIAADSASFDIAVPQGFQVFELIARVVGYSGAGGIAGFFFNGDTGNNYSSRVFVSTSVTNVATTATASIRVASVAITAARGLIWARLEKRLAALTARIIGQTHSDAEAAAAAPLMYSFNGNWNNTTSLITRVGLTGNGVNLLAGSYLEVWGTRDTF